MSASNSERRSTADEVLFNALQDVAIPAGLQARLLSNVTDAARTSDVDLPDDVGDEINKRHDGISRRRWLSLSTAAGIGGLLAIGGQYVLRSRHPLTADVVVHEVTTSLLTSDWVVWQPVNGATPPPLPLPAELRAPRGWQERATSSGSLAIASDMTLPGCPPAVLFAIKTRRNLSTFPVSPPQTPQYSVTGIWSNFAIWRSDVHDCLYVLALQGRKRDYQRLFPSGSTPAIA